MSLAQGVLMFAAAFAAGGINSVAGGGTLITFPVLLWLGLDAKVANATSTVALWPGLFGGGCGAWLLILTPSQTFARLVPYLILFATALFTLQEPISRRLRLSQPASSQTGARWWIGP